MGTPTLDRRGSGRLRSAARRKPPAGASSLATEAFDAFICYAREDTAFVKRISAALSEGGKAVYVDWRIPDWSPDYQSDLVGAIDASDTFLVVVSPDSIASPHCKIELDRAVQQGKRIRPLLVREVDADAVPEQLRRPQWLDFTRSDSFDDGAARLLAAIDVDADWVRTHTRIGVRAGEWDRNGRDSSFLLRGRDLHRAEMWLAGQSGKDPSPTELHVAYVLASRRAAVRRQRTLVGAVSTALLVAIALGLLALLQRQQAIGQRDKATSKGVALQALADLDGGEFDRAVLLSLEALRTKATFEARSAAAMVLQRSDRIQALLRNPSQTRLDAVAVSPDGRLVATGGLDREIHVWDVATRRPYCPPLRLARLDEPTALVFSPRGRKLVAGYNGSNTTIWSLSRSGGVAVPLQGGAGYTWRAAVSPDGGTIATAGFTGEIDTWDARNGLHLKRLRGGLEDSLGGDVAFLGRRELADYTDGVLTVHNWRNGRVVARRPLSGAPLFEAFSVGGDRLATSHRGRYTVWDVRSQRAVGSVNPNAPGSAALGPHGRALALLGSAGEITVWDTKTGAQRDPTLRGDTRPTAIAFGWDGTRLAAAGNGLVTVWRLTGGSGLSRVLAGDPRQTSDITSLSLHGALAFGRDGLGGLVWASNNGLIVWDQSESRIVRRKRFSRDLDRSFQSFAISPDGRSVAVANVDQVKIWRVDRNAAPVTLPLGANALAYSPDGRLIASGGDTDDGSIRLWDAHSGAQLGKPVRTSREVIWDVAFNPDGTQLASVGYGDNVSRWRVEAAGDDRARLAPARPNRLRGQSGAVQAAAFSPDSRLLATGDRGGTIRLWSAATGRPVGEPLATGGSIDDLAFDPRSAILASSDSGAIRLWDIENGRELGSPLRANEVTALAFRADGEMLASTDTGEAVVVWDPVLWTRNWSRIADRLCPILSRNLTTAEWEQFLPGRPHHATCVE